MLHFLKMVVFSRTITRKIYYLLSNCRGGKKYEIIDIGIESRCNKKTQKKSCKWMMTDRDLSVWSNLSHSFSATIFNLSLFFLVFSQFLLLFHLCPFDFFLFFSLHFLIRHSKKCCTPIVILFHLISHRIQYQNRD